VGSEYEAVGREECYFPLFGSSNGFRRVDCHHVRGQSGGKVVNNYGELFRKRIFHWIGCDATQYLEHSEKQETRLGNHFKEEADATYAGPKSSSRSRMYSGSVSASSGSTARIASFETSQCPGRPSSLGSRTGMDRIGADEGSMSFISTSATSGGVRGMDGTLNRIELVGDFVSLRRFFACSTTYFGARVPPVVRARRRREASWRLVRSREASDLAELLATDGGVFSVSTCFAKLERRTIVCGIQEDVGQSRIWDAGILETVTIQVGM